MPSFTTRLDINEAKKHSIRYDHPDGDARLRTVYLGKEVFGLSNYPESVTVTVEWKE